MPRPMLMLTRTDTGLPGRRTGRGVTLIATVLLTLLAASIGLVVIRQTLVVTRTEATRADVDAAARAADAAVTDFTAQLAADPRVFTTQVLTDAAFTERARICLPTGAVVQPGSAWPASCGQTWTYTQASTSAPVHAEVRPPSPDDPTLQFTALATVGQAQAGRRATYRLDGAAGWTVWTSGNLTLDDLAAGTGGTTISGAVYSAGTITVPTATSGVHLSGAALAAEDGFPLPPTDTDQTYYAATADTTANPPIGDIRALAPAALAPGAAAAAVDRDLTLACPTAAPTRLPSGYATSLCLHAGATLTDTSGASVSVPAAAKAYLLLFGASGDPGTVDVYATTSTPAQVGGCLVRCADTTLASAEVNAGTHPGAKNYWTGGLVGTLPLPSSGLVATDATTYLGLCGTGFLTAGASCDVVSGTNPGMLVSRDVTVIAGSTTAPADVYFSGPVRTDGTHHLGVVATGAAIVPYWSRPSGGDDEVDAALLALNLNRASDARTSAALRSLPATVSPSPGTADEVMGGTLTWRGSLGAPDLSVDLPTFTGLTVAPDAGLAAAPPPWMPGFTDTWAPVTGTTLTPVAICGARTCPSW